ncbi:crotonase/enoyl-CoA hydratase family protein [Thalassotalea sp. PLHSN55]|uniref:crotonase/enoyl-CoA hydratase family protein n=1 Tax=Thalassotalea sp. PLHSN55 TaxID=3435888 RepID=UPI003F847447
MHFETLSLEITEDIAYVALARPEKHNAINATMFIEIVQVIKHLKSVKTLRAVIVSGQGEGFSSGLDVKSVLQSPKLAAKFLAKWLPWHSNKAQQLCTGWRELKVPVIMALHGRCWGGGLQIALGGDFRIATPSASLSIMEGKWGLIPDMGGTLAMREVLNQDVAKEMAMTAKVIDGTEAHRVGLVTHISDDPMAFAKSMAKTITEQSPDAVAAVKKLYNKSWWSSPGLALARESWYQIKVILGKNYKIKAYNQTHDESKHKPFKF